MIFSSYKFIFIFLPIVLGGFHLLRLSGKRDALKAFLVLASLAFYGIGQPRYFFLFFGSVLFNYLMVLLMQKKRESRAVRVTALCLSVIENIGLLLLFKYTNFFFENINRLFGTSLPMLTLLLPVGISFFTFQILACSVSVFRGETERISLLDYFLFITFFPQLIVGPVVLHGELMPQLEGDGILKCSSEDFMRGVVLFSMGAAKKTLLANPMIDHAAAYYASELSQSGSTAAWVGMLAYVFAYYFDFSGYIDMARGLGYMFGLRLPVNFDSPYKATDFADFWRRWNMTVSRFFDQTVFANLFGFGDRIPKLIFATMCTFLVSGLWHGAAWHFVIWGAVNGILVALSNILTLNRVKIPKAVGLPVTFSVMALVRVIFDAPNMTGALNVYRAMFSFGDPLSAVLGFVRGNWFVTVVMAVSAFICFFMKNSNEICDGREMKPRHAVLAAGLLTVSLFFMGQVSTFLYFSF